MNCHCVACIWPRDEDVKNLMHDAAFGRGAMKNLEQGKGCEVW